MHQVLQIRNGKTADISIESRVIFPHCCQLKLLIWSISFFCTDTSMQRLLRVAIKINNQVETLVGLLHNPHAFTSPVDEVVAWGEDTWP